jgi:hypothetical protein
MQKEGIMDDVTMINEIPEPGSRYLPEDKEHADANCSCCLYTASDFITNAIIAMHNGNESEFVTMNALIGISLHLEALTAEIGAIKRTLGER